MAHTHTQSNPAAAKAALDAAIAKGYEPDDLKLRGIFVFIGVLAMTLLVVLTAIYAIMMALVEHGRTTDAVTSPLVIKLPPVYAPLQPSLGYNGDKDNDHDWLDQDDMLMMRQKVDFALKQSGTSSTGRRFLNISTAIDEVSQKNMLTVNPPKTWAPVTQPANPKGTWEGYTPNIEAAEPATNALGTVSTARN
jgi:hypothetical protein